MSITETVKPKNPTMFLGPFLKLNPRCKVTYKTVRRKGSSEGLKLRLDKISPFSSAIKALCMPQPGQSKPVRLFMEQVNKCCSKKLINF
jgi:hypothetical protein